MRNDTSLRPALRDQVARRVQLNRRRGAAGGAVEHEELYRLVEEAFGPAAALYFDEHGDLPYLTERGAPWPMKYNGAIYYRVLRVASLFVVFWAAMSIRVRLHLDLPAGATLVGILVISAACGVAFFLGLPHLMSRFFSPSPQDLAVRIQRASEYRSLVERLDQQRSDDAVLRRMEALEGLDDDR